MITIEPENTFEEFEIVVNHDPAANIGMSPEDVNNRVYYLCFLYTDGVNGSNTFCTSVWIDDTASETEMRNALRPFMDHRGVGGDYSVTRTITDYNGAETTVEDTTIENTGARVFTYRVKLHKLRDDFLFYADIVYPGNTTAFVDVLSHVEISPSLGVPSAPLGGKFAVECEDPNNIGQFWKTDEMDVASTQAWQVESAMQT